MSISSQIRRAERLLDREHDALVCADYELLGRLLEEKMSIFSGLADDLADGRHLVRIRAKAERNQLLLEAAANGIRAACQAIDQIAGAGAELTTYDRRGKISSAGLRTGKVRRV